MENLLYVTSIMAIASFLLVYVIMPKYISYLKGLGFNQEVSEYSLKEFKEKAKTPIMGGLLFILVPIVLSLIILPFYSFGIKEIIVLLSYFGFGVIGFIDDFLIIKRHKNEGLKPKYKLYAQFGVAILISIIISFFFDTSIHIPFTSFDVDLGLLYYALVIIMFVGESNAVNFTDGMDGLCAGTVSIVLVFYGILAYMANAYGILVIIIGIIAALLAYLRYNFFPAKIFMGDSGSLALGALLVSLSLVLEKELALILLGGTFLIEMLSVVIQRAYYKKYRKRIFPYTPIHYSFVIKGWHEKKVVLMFYIVTFIFAVLGFFAGIN